MNLLGKSVLEIKRLIQEKKISSKEVRGYFLERIKKYNPTLNAFITVVEEQNKGIKGDRGNQKLNGIPIGIKDNFCTKGIRTTAAAKLLENFVPPYESTVSKRILGEGFSIIGKTNMDAWCHGSSNETSEFGAVKNPWDITRAPGGSSGGSAVAMSAYLVPATIGEETAGSIRLPSSWSGVVGLKPTYGRVSRYGVIAMGSSFDCPGPITLNVKDAAYLLGVIAGKDIYDATSSNRKKADYLSGIETKRKMVIGIAEEYFEGVDAEIENKILNVVDIFKKMGHTIKKIKLLSPDYAISVYTILQRAEVSSNLSRFDGVRYGHDRSYFREEAKRRIMLGTYTLSYGYYDAYYKKAQKVRTLIIEDFNRVFNEVDVIVGPVTPVTALKLGEFEKYPFFGELMDKLNEPAAIAGITSINLPVGLDKNNLPIGMQIMGNQFQEETILNLAYQLERETEFFGVIKKGLENYKD